jgi:hypothetical protein
MRIRILLFLSLTFEMPKKKFFCVLLFEGTFYIMLNEYNNDRRIQEAQKHVDLVDLDPDSDPDP